MTTQPISAQEYFGVTPKKQKSELDSETFMRLLTVQLANQNPLEPMNDRDFFAQMAQLGTVDGIGKLEDSMNVLQATNLIGKTITAVRPLTAGGTNNIVTGTAEKLSIRNGEYYVGLKEADGGIVEVQISNIQSVTA